MKLAIYTTDRSGNLIRNVTSRYHDLDDAINLNHLNLYHPKTEMLAGWPESGVTWYGNVGFSLAKHY